MKAVRLVVLTTSAEHSRHPTNREDGRQRRVSMSSSRVRLLVLAACGVLLSANLGHATCDPSTDPDKSDIANARAAVAANCDCAGAINHGDYVTCAAKKAKAALTNKRCTGLVKK